MLRLAHEKELPAAFNVSKDEKDMLIQLITQLIQTKGHTSVTWAIERLWIDERFSDNLRAFAIFLLGYTYALQNGKEDKNGRNSID